MKVLMVSQFYYPHIGGKENWCRQVSERLVKRGVKVTVLTSAGDFKKQVEVLNGVKVVRQPLIHRFRLYTACLILPKLSFSEQYDLVHFIEPSSISYIPFLICKIKHIPFVVNFHNEPVANSRFSLWTYLLSPYRKLLRNMLMTCKKILTYESLKKSELLSGLEHKTVYITTGIDLSKFQQCSTFNLKNNGNNILFVGRLEERKGLRYLFEAAKNLADIQLTIIGGPLTEISRYKQLAEKLGISSRVNFTGELRYERLNTYYNSAEMLVLPSLGDSFSQVCLEALACGKPVIVTENVGFSITVKKENVGVVVPPHDSKAIADAINYLLHNPKIVMEMSERGRKLVKAYDYEIVTDIVKKVYEEILRENRNR
jgi:glycosyltransferase involved in cell wall biosynthesis